MIHLIMTDFDGTLFPRTGGELTEPFIRKIINLADRGTLFAVNSGRPYSVLRKMLSPLANRTVFICNDGAQIMYKNCLLYKQPIGEEAAHILFGAAHEMGLSPFAALRERSCPVPAETLMSKSLFGEDIYKIILVKNHPNGESLTLLRELGAQQGLRVCFEDEMYLEFCRRETDKGSAAAYLKKRFQITEQIAAFGDSPADLPMFRQADRVYVMKDAKDVSYPGAAVVENMQDFVVQWF